MVKIISICSTPTVTCPNLDSLAMLTAGDAAGLDTNFAAPIIAKVDRLLQSRKSYPLGWLPKNGILEVYSNIRLASNQPLVVDPKYYTYDSISNSISFLEGHDLVEGLQFTLYYEKIKTQAQ